MKTSCHQSSISLAVPMIASVSLLLSTKLTSVMNSIHRFSTAMHTRVYIICHVAPSALICTKWRVIETCCRRPVAWSTWCCGRSASCGHQSLVSSIQTVSMWWTTYARNDATNCDGGYNLLVCAIISISVNECQYLPVSSFPRLTSSCSISATISSLYGECLCMQKHHIQDKCKQSISNI
jgi:hypothetical protein